MGKSIRNYLILLGLVVVVMAFMVFSNDKEVDWRMTYNARSKQPYGLYIFGEELKHFFTKEVSKVSYTPYEYLIRNQKKDTYNYIFTEEDIDEVSLEKILSEVKQGSQALFLNTSYHVNDTLGIAADEAYYVEDQEVQLVTSSYNERVDLTLKGRHSFDRIDYFTILDKNRDKALGYIYYSDEGKIRKKINFVEVPFGRGKFFIHLGPPIVFTNYYLKEEPKARKYASTILSYLPKDNKTIWFDSSLGSTSSSEFLSFVMSQPALMTAWRLMLLGFLFYLIFKGKRQQRIIPVIEKPKNTTIEFAQSVSSLYYQEGDASDLVQKKITYFLDNVRGKYYLDTQEINEAFAQRLHNKSGRDKQLVDKIVACISQFESTHQANESTLTDLDKWIGEFWNYNN